MLETETDRRRTERRRRIARCSYRSVSRNVPEKCSAPARWRCTGCGRFGCPRHRIRLENPDLCSFCTGQIVHFVDRGTSRRKS